ncbi:MAG: glycine betaine ABC transporter substrate-binding protein [Bacillota bacterium]
MSIKRILTVSLTVMLFVGMLFVIGCEPDEPEVTIGSKEFTEQLILGQVAIQALEDAGIPTEDETNLGGTQIAREALEKGDIDMYWEYTGTALVEFMEHDVITDPEEAYATIAEWDESENELVWLQKTPFNNTYTIMMRQEDSEEMGIETLSDLAEAINEGREAPEPGEWTFATDHEYEARDDGLEQLQEHYGFEFDDYEVMDLGITYGALDEGEHATALGFATDARIAEFNLVNLEDDQGFHPVYNCAPVVRQETLDEFPEIADILNPIAEELTPEEMSSMNLMVDVEGMEADEAAAQWLQEKGFIEE